tara:strand:+ start:600 stop:911 length:312 start_codon:yes stop_codon:yes gene_type:complete
MENKEKQSRESQTQILSIEKDIEHLKYIIKELEKDLEKLHKRFGKHLQTEIEYHQSVRDKATDSHSLIHKRIAQAERWIWIFLGGFMVIGALLGKSSFTSIFN